MTKLPPSGAGRLADDYPDVWKNYTVLGKSVSDAESSMPAPVVC